MPGIKLADPRMIGIIFIDVVQSLRGLAARRLQLVCGYYLSNNIGIRTLMVLEQAVLSSPHH